MIPIMSDHPFLQWLLRESGIPELLLAVLIVLLLRRYLAFFCMVKGRSMQHTLQDHDFLFVLSARAFHPRKGDIVICHYPGRYVMWPRKMRTAVRGQMAKHPRFARFLRPFSGRFFRFRQCFVKRLIALPGDTVEIREGIVLVNGQPEALPTNAASAYGPYVNKEMILLKDDECYVLGDNRAISNDCHLIGPIRAGDLAGRVSHIFHCGKSGRDR